jgi:hypothetical protein
MYDRFAEKEIPKIGGVEAGWSDKRPSSGVRMRLRIVPLLTGLGFLNLVVRHRHDLPVHALSTGLSAEFWRARIDITGRSKKR